MDLGIKGLSRGLQSIAYGRLYAVSCADELLAARLTAHFLKSISDFDMLRFLATDLSADVFIKYCSSSVLDGIRAHVYSIAEPKFAASSLPSELRFLKKLPKCSLAVIVMNTAILRALDKKERARFLERLLSYCCSNDSAVLIVNYGAEYETLATSLLENSGLLSGISSLGYRGGAPYLDVMLWRDEGRFARSQDFLVLDENGFACQSSNEDEMQSSTDERVCYLKKGVLDVDRAIFESVLDFVSNEEIFEAAKARATSASVFFALENRQDLEKIARLVFELRQSCGNFLHIFIIERVNGLRASSIRFFFSSGADFVFDSNAKSAYINAILPIFLSSKFRRSLAGSFDNLCDAYRRMDDESNGFVMFDDFCNKAVSLLQDTKYAHGGGTLVRLKPKNSFTLEECLKIFKPKRGGDYCTVRGGCLLVFMASCRGAEILTALRNVFTVDPLSVFDGSRVYMRRDEIVQVLNSSSELEDDDDDVLLNKLLQEHEEETRRTVNTQGVSSYIKSAGNIKAELSSITSLLDEDRS